MLCLDPGNPDHLDGSTMAVLFVTIGLEDSCLKSYVSKAIAAVDLTGDYVGHISSIVSPMEVIVVRPSTQPFIVGAQ